MSKAILIIETILFAVPVTTLSLFGLYLSIIYFPDLIVSFVRNKSLIGYNVWDITPLLFASLFGTYSLFHLWRLSLFTIQSRPYHKSLHYQAAIISALIASVLCIYFMGLISFYVIFPPWALVIHMLIIQGSYKNGF